MGSSYLYTKKMPVNAYGLDHDVVGTPCAGMNDITEEMGERKMFKIFDKKCKEYGLEEKNIFIGDIYIVWPLKESKCRALTLSTP